MFDFADDVLYPFSRLRQHEGGAKKQGRDGGGRNGLQDVTTGGGPRSPRWPRQQKSARWNNFFCLFVSVRPSVSGGRTRRNRLRARVVLPRSTIYRPSWVNSPVISNSRFLWPHHGAPSKYLAFSRCFDRSSIDPFNRYPCRLYLTIHRRISTADQWLSMYINVDGNVTIVDSG